jgi:hypothetical protein
MMEPRKIAWRAAPMVTALGSMCGCATIELGEPKTQDVVLRSRVADDVVPNKADADVLSDDLATDIRIVHVCDRTKYTTVERTVRTEKKNTTAWVDWTAGIAGMGGIGAAVGLIVDGAVNVYPDSDTSRYYNPVGPAGAIGIGVAFGAAGVGLLLIPIIDGVRAGGVEQTVQEVTKPGEVIKAGIVCPKRPFARVAVTGQLRDSQGRARNGVDAFQFGKTTDDGWLAIALDQAVPTHTRLRPDDQIALFAEGLDVGTLSIKELYGTRRSEGWALADVEGCRQPTSATSCDKLSAFLDAFPIGPHAEEAQGVLDASRPAINSFADEAAWQKAASESCRSAKPTSAEEACQGVTDYLKIFPDGKHATEAKHALDVAIEAPRRAEAGRQKRAQEMAAEQAKRVQQTAACRQACTAGCKGNKECAQQCVQGRCQ